MRFASNSTTPGDITVRIFYGPMCSTQLNFLVLATQGKVMRNIPIQTPVQSDISIRSFRSKPTHILTCTYSYRASVYCRHRGDPVRFHTETCSIFCFICNIQTISHSSSVIDLMTVVLYGKPSCSHHFLIALSDTPHIRPICKKLLVLIKYFNSSRDGRSHLC